MTRDRPMTTHRWRRRGVLHTPARRPTTHVGRNPSVGHPATGHQYFCLTFWPTTGLAKIAGCGILWLRRNAALRIVARSATEGGWSHATEDVRSSGSPPHSRGCLSRQSPTAIREVHDPPSTRGVIITHETQGSAGNQRSQVRRDPDTSQGDAMIEGGKIPALSACAAERRPIFAAAPRRHRDPGSSVGWRLKPPAIPSPRRPIRSPGGARPARGRRIAAVGDRRDDDARRDAA